MTNEKLIEEARRAYLDAWAETNLEDVPAGTRSRNGIIAALAVFEKAHTPTDEERDALARAWDAGHRRGIRWKRGDAPENPYRSEVPEPSRPPVYLAADLWQTLGAPISNFDAYYERNGWADTWSNLLGTVRDHFRPKCGQDTEGESCVLTAGHLPPHYGSSDVGSHEPVPVPEPQGEPSDAQVLAALNAYYADYMIGPNKSIDDVRPLRTVQDMRAALRAAGEFRS